MEKILTIIGYKNEKISIARIAILGLLLSLLITLKFALGFIPGIEVVTFLIIIYALFLPLMDVALLIASFNLLVLALYGFGGWWVVYWVIWPFNALAAKGLSKITRNIFAFSVLSFILGTMVMIWYFISDIVFFGKAFAIANIITAIPINIIEGITTAVLMVALGPKLIRTINEHSGSIWGDRNKFVFKVPNNKKLFGIISVVIAFAGIGGIATLFIKNSFFISLKQNMVGEAPKGHLPEGFKGPEGMSLLPAEEYNDIYNDLKENEVAIVVIANNKHYVEEINIKNDHTLSEVIDRLTNISFKIHSVPVLGDFLLTFKLANSKNWMHGISNSKNYGDYHPMFTDNHIYSNFGVTSAKVLPKHIYEITYDHGY